MLAMLAAYALLSALAPVLVRCIGTKAFILLAALPAGNAVWISLAAPQILTGGAVVEHLDWIPELGLTLSFRIDALSWVMSLVVTLVGALVLLYCSRYFDRDEPGLGRFAGLLLAFAGVMFGLVTSDDLLMLFVFWEATSVLSYLLIGHMTNRRESRGAALQALLVTTLGGLVMLVGIVILMAVTGTASISAILAEPPVLTDPLVITAIMLILVGAISKSAIFPFHFWLPGAMAAPTPVSAYLHAAAMVKAGIYLILRLAPAFAATPGWHGVLITLGAITMITAGWRALRQNDLKVVLAHGTVSQLGFLAMAASFGSAEVALAALALLIGHAAFKGTLFLVVGIIDHETGTRDLREISGLGRQRPLLFVVALVAAASMAGLPPLFGFVAKEAVLTTLLEAPVWQDWAVVIVVATVIGSALTVAYSARFLWGAFASKPDVEPVHLHASPRDIMIAPVLLALATVVAGLAPWLVEAPLQQYAATVPGEVHYHLALWHGLEPALGLSAIAILAGLALFWQRATVARVQAAIPRPVDMARGYWGFIRTIDRLGLVTTHLLQRGGLPGYVAMILAVFVASLGFAAAASEAPKHPMLPWDYELQPVIAVVMIIAGIAAAVVHQRFTAVLLVGVTGYGLVALFAFHGAPDLALTQSLVETVTLVVFVLVLRRLPVQIAQRNASRHRLGRAIIGIAVGAVMAAVAVLALSARVAPSISPELPGLAYEGGHGKNVVNVMLVDIRAWDTMGEISVLVAVATGVASLLFVTGREGPIQRLTPAGRGTRRRRAAQAVVEPDLTRPITVLPESAFAVEPGEEGFSAGADEAPTRRSWLLAGRTLSAANRSILLEVLVRLLFHPAMIVSVFLLFTGHNAPGGGFAGGLLAGLALLARYLAGGRYELGEAAPIDAGLLLGGGLTLAVGTAVSSMFFGLQVLQSSWFEADFGPLHISVGTSTLFDIGVYLVVLGVVLDVLRSLGAQIDRHQDELTAAGAKEGRA